MISSSFSTYTREKTFNYDTKKLINCYEGYSFITPPILKQSFKKIKLEQFFWNELPMIGLDCLKLRGQI